MSDLGTMTVRDLHDRAMTLAQEAMLARGQGDLDRAVQLAAQAVPLEMQAARQIPKTEASEPTRSILYLSAASLAFQSQDVPLARRLAHDALSGYPPSRTIADLYELLENLG